MVSQGNNLAFDGVHGHDELVGRVKVDIVNAGKKFLQMCLNDGRLGGLAKDLEQVVIADEIKSRKARPFLFQELVEALLATLQPIQHGREGALDGADPEQSDDPIVPLSVRHDHPEVVIDLPEHLSVVEPLNIGHISGQSYRYTLYFCKLQL